MENPLVILNNLQKNCVFEEKDNVNGDPATRFVYKLTIDGKLFVANGPNKKIAKQGAARVALKHPDVNPRYKEYRAMLDQEKAAKKAQNQKPQSSNVAKQEQLLRQLCNPIKSQKQQQQKQSSGILNLRSKSSTQVKDMLLKQIQEHSSFVTIDGRKICRPFLNSSCVRGNNCPYLHLKASQPGPPLMPAPQQVSALRPTTQQVSALMPLPDQVPSYRSVPQQSSMSLPNPRQAPLRDTFRWLQLCEDFSNHRCTYGNCPYLHVSTQDEDDYCATGRIPNGIVDQAIRKAIVDEVAPPGFAIPCKAYLNGECSWFSCPFRHISYQEISQEVTRILGKHFDSLIGSSSKYRLLDNRISDVDRFAHGMQMPLSRGYHQLSYESSQELELDQYRRPVHERLGNNYLVSGMSGFMREPSVDANQLEINKLRDELRMLNEENEKLRNSMQVMSLEENRMLSHFPYDSKHLPNKAQRPLMIGQNLTAPNYRNIWIDMQKKDHTQQIQIGMKQSAKNVKSNQATYKVPAKKSGQLNQASTKSAAAKKYFNPVNKEPKKQKPPNQQNQTITTTNQQNLKQVGTNQQQNANKPKQRGSRRKGKAKADQKSVNPVATGMDSVGVNPVATGMDSVGGDSDVVIECDQNRGEDEGRKCSTNESVEEVHTSDRSEKQEMDDQNGSESANVHNGDDEVGGQVENVHSGDDEVEGQVENESSENEEEEDHSLAKSEVDGESNSSEDRNVEQSEGSSKNENNDAAGPMINQKSGDGESEKWADAVDESSSS